MGADSPSVAAERVAAERAAAARVYHLVAYVEIENVLAQAEDRAKSPRPLRTVLEVNRAARLDYGRVLSGREVLPVNGRIDTDVTDVIHPALYAEQAGARHPKRLREPGLGAIEAVDHTVVVLQHLIAVDRVLQVIGKGRP